MTAVEMIRRCFEHQHPEEYGRGAVPEPSLPSTLRYGPGDDLPPVAETLAQEDMGHPEAYQL
jgi:hypothetical protein